MTEEKEPEEVAEEESEKAVGGPTHRLRGLRLDTAVRPRSA